MEFVIEPFTRQFNPVRDTVSTLLTACIADSMALLVSPPQRSDRCPAILASNHNGRVLVVFLRGSYVSCIGVVNALALNPVWAGGLILILKHAETGALGDAVIVCRTTAASLCSASTIATATTRTRSGRHVIGSNVLGSRCI